MTQSPTEGAAPAIAVTGAGPLIVLQFSTRLLTVVMGQAQVRLTTAEAFGAANIQMELVLATMLAFSREGFRNALSRQRRPPTIKADPDAERQRRIDNVALLPLIIGLPICLAVMWLYRTYLAPNQLVNHPHFAQACGTFLAGALLELAVEPLYIAALRDVRLQPRVWSEGAGVLVKGAVTLGVMILFHRRSPLWSVKAADVDGSLLPFGLGQLGYGLAVAAVFLLDSIVRRGVSSTAALYHFHGIFQHGLRSSLDGDSVRLAVSMTRQNAVKHVLGEGDKFAVARLASLSDQGAYALASNYGSLVARLLYQPIEEVSRLTFASTLGSAARQTTSISLADLTHASDLLRHLLAFYVLLGAMLVTFCPPLTVPLLMVLAGPRWALQTNAPRILAVYGACYLPVMACNGLLEGFLQATASTPQLSRYDGLLMGASVTFGATLAALIGTTQWTHLSAEVALILATTISTSVRAVYCLRYARNYLMEANKAASETSEENKSAAETSEGEKSPAKTSEGEKSPAVVPPTVPPLGRVLPNRIILIAFTVLSAMLYRSAKVIEREAWRWPWSAEARQHVIMGLSGGLMLMVILWDFERHTIVGALDAIRGRRRERPTPSG